MTPSFDFPSFEEQRQRMVDTQIKARGILDERVLKAMREIPRHEFIPYQYRESAYQDRPLSIGENQTISQPYIVGYMTEKLKLQPEDRALEIGTGSGYQAAVLSKLVKDVFSIERHETLFQTAKKTIEYLGYSNVHLYHGDGSMGLMEKAPYDAIMITAAAPEVPEILLEQLTEGGRLILPVGPRRFQHLELWQRKNNSFQKDQVLSVAFVPLKGQYGWDDSQWK